MCFGGGGSSEPQVIYQSSGAETEPVAEATKTKEQDMSVAYSYGWRPTSLITGGQGSNNPGARWGWGGQLFTGPHAAMFGTNTSGGGFDGGPTL